MKDYIRKRVLEIGKHILATKHTVRQEAVVFGVSKSTVHKEHSKWNGCGAGKRNNAPGQMKGI